MYKIKRFSITLPTEKDYYEGVDNYLLNPLDQVADKIGHTGIVTIDKKTRNIKGITTPLKKWNKYKRNKLNKN